MVEYDKVRRSEEDIYWSQFKTIHFCQIISANFKNHLALPKKFVDKLGNKLPGNVTLRGPSESEWDIGLSKKGDDVFLDHGWRTFAEDHSLAENDFLYFTYDRNSVFDVIVLDHEKCEREASYFIKKRENAERDVCTRKRKREDSYDDINEFSDDDHEPPQVKKLKNTASHTTRSPSKNQNRKDSSPRGTSRSSDNVHCEEPKSLWRVVADVQKDNAYEMAEAASTETSFISVMRTTQIRINPYVTIPSEWGKKFLHAESHDVTLHFEGKTWPTICRYKCYRDGYPRRILYEGWKDFVVHNSLKESDVCVFDLVSGNSIVLDVKIFRVGEAVPASPATKSASRAIGRMNEPAARSSDSSQEGGKKHSTSMRPQQQPTSLGLVVDEAHKQRAYEMAVAAKRESSFIQKRVNAERGYVCTHKRKLEDSYDDIIEFLDDDHEHPEVKKPKNAASNTTRSPSNNENRKGSSPRGSRRGSDNVHGEEPKSRGRVVADEQKGNAHEMAEAASTETSFILVMRTTHICRSPYATIPSAWGKKFLRAESQDVMLHFEGEIWPTICHYKCYKGRSPWRMLYEGWKDFVVDNSLKESDVCVFDLVSGNSIVLDVKIFRVEEVPPSPATKSSSRTIGSMNEPATRSSDSSRAGGKEHSTSMCPQQQPASLGRVVDEAEKQRAYEMAVAAKRESSFISVLYPTYLDSYAPIPSDWAKKYITDEFQDIELHFKDKKWPAKCHYNCYDGSITQPRLKRGWEKFVVDNSLKSFDVCLFHLVNRTYDSITLDVQIFRVKPAIVPSPATKATLRSAGRQTTQNTSANDSSPTGGKKHSNSTHSGKPKPPSPRHVIDEHEMKKAYQLAVAAKTETSFIVVMRASYFIRSYAPIPIDWAKDYLPYKDQDAELRFNGKLWAATSQFRRDGHKVQHRLVHGWKNFVNDNSLNMSDVCLFELVDGTYDSIVFDVKIFRVEKTSGEDKWWRHE